MPLVISFLSPFLHFFAPKLTLLQTFFGTIRQAAGCNDHPGCATFLQLYKLLSVYSIIKPPMYGNCTVAERKPPEILVSIEDLIKNYGRHESRTPEIVTKLRSKLDELIEYENWAGR